MGDEGPVESGPEVTSDYEPSQEGSMFGSLSSSVREHVWEYGRCARPHAPVCVTAP